MEKIKINFTEQSIKLLDDLVEILFLNQYFSSVEYSEKYVNKIYNFIEFNLATFPHKKTPAALNNFSLDYIFFKINPRTTWYIFFEKQNNNYLITQIIINHCKEAKHFQN